ncbi:MAG: hypothetical protein R3250_16885 [Melioribacteraceae bacterium]|nr:hypothetical protein [Melioribacteraceae bacterium]
MMTTIFKSVNRRTGELKLFVSNSARVKFNENNPEWFSRGEMKIGFPE